MSQSSSRNGSNGSSGHDETSARQCVKYTFFKVDSAFRRLPDEKQADLKLELISTIRQFNRRMLLRSYSLFGLRGDVDFMLWQVADEMDAFNALSRAIFSTGIAAYLETPHSLLGMTRKSMYDIGAGSDEEEAERIIIQPGDGGTDGSAVTAASEVLDLRLWQAAKSGVEGTYFDSGSRTSVPVKAVIQRALDYTGRALHRNGDEQFVANYLDSLATFGNGATRQRESWNQGGAKQVAADAAKLFAQA